MHTTTRRKFIKASVAGVTYAAFAPKGVSAVGASLPSHTPMVVKGVHAYARQESVEAGKSIEFCASADVLHHFSVCRLGRDPDSPFQDETLHVFPEREPEVQPIHPGSYVYVSKGLKHPPVAWSLECWVRPWAFGGWQDVVSQMDYPDKCDFALAISPEGQVVFYQGDGNAFNNAWPLSSEKIRLKEKTWSHVVLISNGRLRSVWLDGQKVAETETSPESRQARWGAPLRLAAGGTKGRTADFFDGDLAMTVLYDRALSESEIVERFRDRGLTPAKGNRVLACWDFHEEKGDSVQDISGQKRHGRIINHATWMIGGPSFDSEAPRFGDYDPAEDPDRGHGLRFASDDLYDCGWEVTHRYRIPRNAKPGLYVGRLKFPFEGRMAVQHVTFVVRKRAAKKRAPILVLCSTHTWRAYNGTPFGKPSSELMPVFGTGGTENSEGDPPAFNFYRPHAAGQGTYQVGRYIPWPAAGPYVLYGGPTQYSHLMRAERFAHIWLEEAGYDFDVVTDLDLHGDPSLLIGYQAVLLNGHSEYWSREMYRGLEQYLGQGGNVVVLSGNSLFWRVSWNEDLSVLECRKVDAPGNQMAAQARGECWHSEDGMKGGLTNECGMPGWKLIGLTTLGWNNQGNPKNFGPYIAEATDHFLFHHPEETGLKVGDRFGWAGEGRMPMANGHEIDVRLSTLAGMQEQPSPDGVQVPEDPAGMVRLANGVVPWKEGGAAFDYWFNPIKPKTDQGGEMIYWERPEGGTVFNAGSIGSGWALHKDPNFQVLMRNVLHAMGVERPQPRPSTHPTEP